MTSEGMVPGGADADLTLTAAPAVRAARAFGQYRLLQQLGEGGMGEVWLAEQLQPVRRQLAIKLIKAGMDTHQVIARFEAERQALALMDHPGIAKVLDAGSTPEGRPYFAMEYVRGEPITVHCERCGLTPAGATRAVSRGVRRGAARTPEGHHSPGPQAVERAGDRDRRQGAADDHRLRDCQGDEPAADRAHTAHGAGQRHRNTGVHEPRAGGAERAGCRHAHGRLRARRVLYQLLTGALPLDISSAREIGIDEVRRTIREVQPARPSTRAQGRGAAIRGDLDWITMKALEKERARRYGSVSELAADVRRHLDDQPVSAGPPTAGYRASKFLRRHRLAVSIGAVAIVFLVGFAAAMAVQTRRIATERDRANVEAQTARQTAAFLTELFTVSDPSEARGNTLTATQILDKGAAEIDRTLMAQPELRARLQTTIGKVYTSLGRYSAAEPLLTKAAATLRSISGADAPETLAALDALAELYWNQERLTDAEALYTEVVAGRTRGLGPDHRETLKAQFNLASTYIKQRQLEKSLALTQAVLERQRRTLATDDRDTIASLGNLSSVYFYLERYAEALPPAMQALELRRKLLGASHPDTLAGAHNVTVILSRLGRVDEAATLLREALVTMQQVQGHGHPSTTASQVGYAKMLQTLQRFPEAETQLLEAFGALTVAGHNASEPSTQQVISSLSPLTDWGKAEKGGVARED